MNKIQTIAKQLVTSGKGIVAADESDNTANKRFAAVGVEQTEENRRRYRQLLFTAPDVADYVSGLILYDETIRQLADDGRSFAARLQSAGIIPGIKVDLGLKDLPNFEGEKVSQGLDNLDTRLSEYYALGARFTKWRSVIAIGDNTPSEQCIAANAHVLTRYAGIVQAVGMVPIVEPEVLFDGPHDLAECQTVLAQTLQVLFGELTRFRIDLSGLILKTSMVLPGKDSGQPIVHEAVAEATAKVLRENVPAETGGVVFLSGGQASGDAIANLNEIAKRGPYPWGVTFSYSRALQDPVLKYWAEHQADTAEAQAIFIRQLQKASAASGGNYDAVKDQSEQFVSDSQDL